MRTLFRKATEQPSMKLDDIKAHCAHLAQLAREAGFAVQVDAFGRGTFLASSTDTIERLLQQGLKLKPMASAPALKDGEPAKLLVLNEGEEGVRSWELVYWLDAFDGRPAGWYGRNCVDLRNPVGWVLATTDLPMA